MDKDCEDDAGWRHNNEMDWRKESGEAYWDIGIDGMSESVRMEKWIRDVDKLVLLSSNRKKQIYCKIATHY